MEVKENFLETKYRRLKVAQTWLIRINWVIVLLQLACVLGNWLEVSFVLLGIVIVSGVAGTCITFQINGYYEGKMSAMLDVCFIEEEK